MARMPKRYVARAPVLFRRGDSFHARQVTWPENEPRHCGWARSWRQGGRAATSPRRAPVAHLDEPHVDRAAVASVHSALLPRRSALERAGTHPAVSSAKLNHTLAEGPRTMKTRLAEMLFLAGLWHATVACGSGESGGDDGLFGLCWGADEGDGRCTPSPAAISPPAPEIGRPARAPATLPSPPGCPACPATCVQSTAPVSTMAPRPGPARRCATKAKRAGVTLTNARTWPDVAWEAPPMPMTHYLLLLARLCGVLLYAGGLEAAFVAGGPDRCCAAGVRSWPCWP
jgi:hypothetical protein